MRTPPADDDGDLAWLLFRQDDVISRRQALRVMPEARLRQLVACGRWARPCRAVYVAHNGPLTPAQRAWVAALYAGHGRPASLAGLSALAAHGLRGYEGRDVHVYLPVGLRCANPPSFLVVHRIRRIAREDLHRAAPPRTSPARSTVDAAQWAPNDRYARAVIAAAFQQRLVDEAGMRAALGRLDRVRRRAVIAAAVNAAAGGSESIAEQEFLWLCRRGGLPVPVRQAVTVDSSGRRRYRDVYFDEWRIHVEIDGEQHMEVGTWWADMRRQNDMWIAGDRVLRFPTWAVRNDPDAVLAAVRAALTAAGWRP